MANKNVLLGGREIKVAGRSSFDKGFLNALTSGVGTITPIVKKLVIPSNGRVSVSAHATLPPLATDAYLRSHLKLEAFYTPARLLTGCFQSWFSGEEIYDQSAVAFTRAKLPRGYVTRSFFEPADPQATRLYPDEGDLNFFFGHSTLTDYFNVKYAYDNSGNVVIPSYSDEYIELGQNDQLDGHFINLLPYINYHLLYHHFYRNKSVQRPVFCRPDVRTSGNQSAASAWSLPFVQSSQRLDVVLGSEMTIDGSFTLSDTIEDSDDYRVCTDKLLDGSALAKLRQRNYGDDYFTASRPQAQAGNPLSVQTDSNGRFTIASLRTQNAFQEFEEINNMATPDYVQVNLARYGVSVANGVVDKPIILGSADYPMFTKSVELNAQTAAQSSRNPYAAAGMLGAVGGRAVANGIDFTFDFEAKEVGYIMVLATLVPEANYATGFDHDMRIFIDDGDLTDLPCSLLERIGDEPIMTTELYAGASKTAVFGYVQRYLWHKAGSGNQVHGLYRKGQSLEAFVPQRNFTSSPQISSAFLQIPKTALDDVASVASGVSNYGLELDCAISFNVSEPLSESALPALSDPAREHGRDVYLSNGGSTL